MWGRFALPVLLVGLFHLSEGANKLCNDKLNPVLADLDTLLNEECSFASVVKNFIDMKMKQAGIASNDSTKSAAQREIKKSLTKAMPNGNDRPMTVDLWNIAIADLYVEAQHEINMRGIMLLSWTDDRIAWRYNEEPKTDQIKIHSYSSIWKPDIAYQLSTNSFPYGGNRVTTLHRNGTVFYHFGFWIRTNCELDLSDYPKDRQKCCLRFQSKKYPSLLTVNVRDDKLTYMKHPRFRSWTPTKSLINTDKDEEGNPQLNVCFDLVRPSATIQYFILMPLGATIAIAVLIPLFTEWKLQILAKMLAVFLQFISFNLSFEDEVKEASTVPKYLQLYEFMMWTTVMSMSITVILWAVAKKRLQTPPQRCLTDMAEKVNPWFCGITLGRSSAKPESEAEGATTLTGNGNGMSDWYPVMAAFNNISLVIFTVIYIIGAIIFVV